jgi:hypothetical protein
MALGDGFIGGRVASKTFEKIKQTEKNGENHSLLWSIQLLYNLNNRNQSVDGRRI